jgi:hypothetical protein
MDITEKQIEQLRIEAGNAGDSEMVALCRAALECDDADAWEECRLAVEMAVSMRAKPTATIRFDSDTIAMSRAMGWIDTDRESVLDDIGRLGLDAAVAYNYDMLRDCVDRGDARWCDVTRSDLAAAMFDAWNDR